MPFVLPDGAKASEIKRVLKNPAASGTDTEIVAAVSGKKIRVIAVVALAGATATDLTFNTKPGGAGSAISPLFANAANAGIVLPRNDMGWFETDAGEGLSSTTGSGSATGIMVVYAEID